MIHKVKQSQLSQISFSDNSFPQTRITISPLVLPKLKTQPRWQCKAHNLVVQQGEDLQRTAGPMTIKEMNAVLPYLFMLF